MISINVNSAASGAGLNLGKSNEALQKSLSRLSSGRRIVNSSDDAGGLAVSMKMAAAQKRTEATAINLANIQSYLQTQDGAFSVADKVLNRMSELTTLARDVTKNPGDVENYDKEFQNLQQQLISLNTEKFNGVPLFSGNAAFNSTDIDGKVFDVPTSEDGSQKTTATKASINSDPFMNMMINGFTTADVNGTKVYIPNGQGTNGQVGYTLADPTTPVSVGTNATATTTVSTGGVLNYDNSAEFAVVSQAALERLADMRAQNGSESSRVGFAQDLLKINATNLEAANSRIIDVDVAAESSQLARFQILQQAGTAMLAQANTSQQSLVRLLQG
jgi:flagellin